MTPPRNFFTIRLLVKLPKLAKAKRAQLAKRSPLEAIEKGRIVPGEKIFEFPSDKNSLAAWKEDRPLTVDIDIPEQLYTMRLELYSKEGILRGNSQVFTLTDLIMCPRGEITLTCVGGSPGWIKLEEIPMGSEQCKPLTHPFASSDEIEMFNTFNHISDVHNLLQGIRFREYASKFIPIKVYDAVDFLTVLLSSLWDTLSNRFPLVKKAMNGKKSGHTAEALQYMRYSIFEDLLIQLKNQMDYIDQWASPQEHLVKRIVPIVLQTCLLMFGWAFYYPLTNLNPVGMECFYPPADEYLLAEKELEKLQTDLLRLRVDMIEHPRVIPASVEREALLEYLFNKTFHETKNANGADVRRPYREIFLLLRGRDAEWASKRIYDQLEAYDEDPSSDRRDLLRRLLAHMAQESDRLPRFIWLDSNTLKLDKTQATRDGSFAFVNRYYWIHKDRGKAIKVAVKAMKDMHVASNEVDVKAFYLEFLLHFHLKHPNIIKVYGVPDDLPHLSIVMPYMDNGDVVSYIKKNKEKRALINKWILQVALGLRYLHREKIVHGDLHGSNVLIDDDDNAVIVDLGMSVLVDGRSSNYGSRRGGQSEYTAPELSRPDDRGRTPRPSKPSDVYSFGVFCIHLYTGTTPLRDQNQRIHSPNHFGIPSALWAVVEQCVDPEKANRPTMETIVESMQERGLGTSHTRGLTVSQ